MYLYFINSLLLSLGLQAIFSFDQAFAELEVENTTSTENDSGFYAAAGVGLFPALGLKAGIENQFGSFEVGYGIGNAGLFLTFDDSFTSDGYFTTLYKTPPLWGFTLRFGPSLSFSTQIIDSYDVNRKEAACMGCEEPVAYSRIYEYGFEAGLGWESKKKGHSGFPVIYMEIDALHVFQGIGHFQRRQRITKDGEEWAQAKKLIDERHEGYELKKGAIHRLATFNIGIKFPI